MTGRTTSTGGVSRRFLLTAGALGAGQLVLSACTTSRPMPQLPQLPRFGEEMGGGFDHAEIYAARSDGGFLVPAVPYERIPSRFLRQYVSDPTGEAPGTVVVDTSKHYLYLVQPGGQAIRYGVGLGRAGFEWSGRAVIQWKRAWPTWTPPDEMIARQPELAKYSADNGGMRPGLDNPLGARALYIFKDNVDTLYRVHGSPEWWSIGKSVSSGCVRMINQDVMDLFNRVPNKTPILVR
ncbi:L,D-transpeptidase [Aquibium microcysteis]|uniref:L,D-transpeptidase n=1 Tax=Aquibium microcysteis TaxID=675281 RepID=UPI00165D0CC0|nr:L,D-transpeptidase [Aquibium microcysteis]